MEYMVVTGGGANLADFTNSVQVLIDDGWQLKGGVGCGADGGHALAQALVKD